MLCKILYSIEMDEIKEKVGKRRKFGGDVPPAKRFKACHLPKIGWPKHLYIYGHGRTKSIEYKKNTL